MHFRLFRFSTTLYLENRCWWSKTDTKLGFGDTMCMWGTIDHKVFKVIMRSFGAFAIFGYLVSHFGVILVHLSQNGL